MLLYNVIPTIKKKNSIMLLKENLVDHSLYIISTLVYQDEYCTLKTFMYTYLHNGRIDRHRWYYTEQNIFISDEQT